MNYKVAMSAIGLISLISFVAGLVLGDDCVDADCHVEPTPTVTVEPEPTFTPTPEPTNTPEPTPTYSCRHTHNDETVTNLHIGFKHLKDNPIGVRSDYNPKRCGHE